MLLPSMQPHVLFIMVSVMHLIICDNQQNAPYVVIDDCQFQGKWDSNKQNVARFFSIPFGKPPVNELRWKEPIPISNYSNGYCINNNSYNATYYHSRCYQLKFGTNTDIWPPQSEDCLNLDIYSPNFNNPNSNNLSIMVYFHGGSSVSGGSFQYDFTNFSVSQNVIVVVPNYRLQLIGFLSFKALSQTSNTLTSGNYGLMDLKLSLKWIKKYIHLFGGNINNPDITIFGQSTGGTAVLSLLSSPSTKGLFNRAISMSGSPNISMDLHTAENQGESIVEIFGCNNYTNDNDIVSCMRAISAINITNIYPQQWTDTDNHNFGIPGPNKTGFYEAGLMIVDGYLVTENIFDALRNGVNDVPLIIGNTQYETDFMPYQDVTNLTTESEFGGFLNNNFIEWGDNFGINLWKTYYEFEWNLGGSQLVYDGIGADSTGFCGTKYLATLASNSLNYKSSVYLYSHQQFPSHPFQPTADWNCTYSFHSIGLFAATFTWNSFKYWGALKFEPQFIDNAFGQNIRTHWKHFLEFDEPLSIWKEYNQQNNYNVALIGNGTNKDTEYNITNMVDNYKSDICEFYMQNDIASTFWWSN